MGEGVPASEAGPRPDCECHGKPMRWNRRSDLRAGGYWRCPVIDLESARRWRAANRDRIKANNKAWQVANVEHRREYQRAWRYGMKPAEYNALVATQGEFCRLCDAPASKSAKGRLHVDHSHVTGYVRGLLCNRCNSALERVENIPDWAERATEYLREGFRVDEEHWLKKAEG